MPTKKTIGAFGKAKMSPGGRRAYESYLALRREIICLVGKRWVYGAKIPPCLRGARENLRCIIGR